MPVEIAVGPPVLSINQGATFMVTDLDGQIAADTERGVYADDIRFVSSWAVFADGAPRSASPRPRRRTMPRAST